MAETVEQLAEEPEAEREAPEDESPRASADDDEDLGCSVEGGLVRL
ncbi:MAG TPA: hypothetical protein VGQ15_07520 [Gaiellaceae bacterium]|jgi:hypothetical protein|nr:hypothetical protein [Gaiellaceae bacterium]